MEKSLNWREFIITRLIKASGYSAILFVVLIFFFLVREGLPTFAETSLSSLFSVRWYPIESYFGILPLITGSLIVTIGAGLVAVPLGQVRVSQVEVGLPVVGVAEHGCAARVARIELSQRIEVRPIRDEQSMFVDGGLELDRLEEVVVLWRAGETIASVHR